MIDLHMHLNGSLTPKIVIEIAKKHNIELPSYDEDELRKMISVPNDCTSLNEYLKCTKIPSLVTQTEGGIEDAVYLLLEDLTKQDFIYAEIRFAPQRHTSKGLSQEEVVEAAIRGLKRSKLKAKLILCCMRGNDLKKNNLETIELAHKYLSEGVGGVDLAGDEATYKTSDYKDIFLRAKELKIPITIHAGEADGPESVAAALDMGATRIGHGLRAIEDAQLLERIAKEKITLELCPSSNLQTGAVNSIKEYPYEDLLTFGVRMTINTDNKTISNTTLEEEYDILRDHFALSDFEKDMLIKNAINASFTNKEEKAYLMKLFKEKRQKYLSEKRTLKAKIAVWFLAFYFLLLTYLPILMFSINEGEYLLLLTIPMMGLEFAYYNYYSRLEVEKRKFGVNILVNVGFIVLSFIPHYLFFVLNIFTMLMAATSLQVIKNFNKLRIHRRNKSKLQVVFLASSAIAFVMLNALIFSLESFIQTIIVSILFCITFAISSISFLIYYFHKYRNRLF